MFMPTKRSYSHYVFVCLFYSSFSEKEGGIANATKNRLVSSFRQFLNYIQDYQKVLANANNSRITVFQYLVGVIYMYE